jgi:hypothetical protein
VIAGHAPKALDRFPAASPGLKALVARIA